MISSSLKYTMNNFILIISLLTLEHLYSQMCMIQCYTYNIPPNTGALVFPDVHDTILYL